MRSEIKPTEASQQYSAAYAAQYTDHELPLALELYEKILATHPDDPEAEYSRMQVRNIVTSVVPKQELLKSNMDLARVYFDRNRLRDAPSKAVTQGA